MSIPEYLKEGVVQYLDKDGNHYLNGEYTGTYFLCHVTPEMYNRINEWFTKTFNRLGDISRQ